MYIGNDGTTISTVRYRTVVHSATGGKAVPIMLVRGRDAIVVVL